MCEDWALAVALPEIDCLIVSQGNHCVDVWDKVEVGNNVALAYLSDVPADKIEGLNGPIDTCESERCI